MFHLLIRVAVLDIIELYAPSVEKKEKKKTKMTNKHVTNAHKCTQPTHNVQMQI